MINFNYNIMKKIFFLSSLFLIFFVGCDTSEPIESDNSLLPKTIKTEQSYDAEPQYDYTHITTFEYDNSDRPVKILKETYRRLNNEKADKNLLVYSISRKLEYSVYSKSEKSLSSRDLVGVTQTDVIKSWIKDNDYSTHTETRVYDLKSEKNNLIEVMLNGKFKETIELSKDLAVKYNKVRFSNPPEENTINYTEEYKYNNKGDVSQYNYISLLDDRYASEEKYLYDSFNGVYKHMNIPQWLFIALFGNEGRIHNIREIHVVHDGKETPFAENIYRYNSEGYAKESVYRPNSELVGIWGSKTTYDYVKAKVSQMRPY